MRKVKKFKLKINSYFVEKKLKEKSDKEIVPEVKKIISEKIKEVENLILPATLYEIFKPEQVLSHLTLKEYLSDVWNESFFSGLTSNVINVVALTLYVITLGKKVKFIEEENYPQIYQAIIETAQEQAVRFVRRLVNEEAKKENYLLGANFDLSEKEKREKIFELIDLSCLGLEKENILREQFGFRIGVIPWFSQRKFKKRESD